MTYMRVESAALVKSRTPSMDRVSTATWSVDKHTTFLMILDRLRLTRSLPLPVLML